MLKALLLVVASATVGTTALAGCGADGEARGRPGPGEPLSVYLSVPHSGDSAEQARAVLAGARLALGDAGMEAGGVPVRLVALDSSDPDEPDAAGGWDPAQVSRNAELAASDPTAVAYIGELDFGGSAVSVPITNDAGMFQVSPGDGLTSLTRALPGAGGLGPQRYYPSGERSFLRLAPTDFLQASTLVRWARLSGARRLALLHDGGVFGRDFTTEASLVASCEGLAVADPMRVGSEVTRQPELVERVAEGRPDAVIYAGAAGDIASPLAGALASELPRARLFAAGGVASFPSPRAGGLDVRLGDDRGSMLVTRSVRPPASYPPQGRRVLERLASRRGRPVPTDALYGYEAMSLVLDAVEAAAGSSDSGAPARGAVLRRALTSRARRSVLGRYRIQAAGDVSETRFGGYRRELGALRPVGIRRPGYRLAARSRVPPAEQDPCAGLLRGGRGNQ